MTKSNFLGGLFLSSRILKGMFTSIFVNCYAASFSLHVWFEVCSFGHNLFGWYKTTVNSKLPLPSLNGERYRVLWLLIWRLLSYNSWAIILMTTGIPCIGCIHIYVAHSNLCPKHALQQPWSPRTNSSRTMKATAASLAPYHLNITSACATTNLLPMALHTMCTLPSTFLDPPLMWYHLPSFFYPSSLPLTPEVTSIADNATSYVPSTYVEAYHSKHALDFDPYDFQEDAWMQGRAGSAV